jgi:hypothetical protein
MATTHPDRPTPDQTNARARWIGGLLIAYLLLIGIGATVLMIADFPHVTQERFPQNGVLIRFQSLGQTLLLFSFLAGVVGSFLHAAQSLITYMGNKAFVTSWVPWYLVRPWIGGVLGITLYFSFRAGLVSGVGDFNPYGVIALGLLGGWFSKTATDKLQEVFETLFRTDADRKRKDKLTDDDRPILDG